MKRIKYSYIGKAVIFPIIVVAALIAISVFAVPKLIDAIPTATDATSGVTEYDESDYYLVNYKNFKDLRLNNFVGWLSSDDIALGCGVTYNSENEDTKAVSLTESSTEPWNDGKITIIGDNTDKEFRNLHKATLNHRFTINFYKHKSYTYEIKEIVPIANRDEIDKMAKENDALLCLKYNDFSKADSAYFYTVYVCNRVK